MGTCLRATLFITMHISGRRGGLVVSTLECGSRGPGSSRPGHCVVFTLLSQCLSPPRSINGYQQTVRETRGIAGRLPAMD